MASQQQNPAGSPTAQVVGNAFVNQYYLILHTSPELVHRFYQQSSKLGRPDADGNMDSVTTLELIDEKIQSMDFLKAEISHIDSQESFNGGVTVLVLGHLTGSDGVKRKFTQSFFLAPQEKGYFVLNDMFRYVPDFEVHNEIQLENGTGELVLVERDMPAQHEHHVSDNYPAVLEEERNEDEVYNLIDNGEGPLVLEEEIPVAEVINDVTDNQPPSVPALTAPVTTIITHDEAPKKSYASIVKVMKENAALLAAPAHHHTARPAPPPKPERQVEAPPVQALALPASDATVFSSNASDSSAIPHEIEDGHSIYVRNLPLNATPQQLEDEFKKFGTIRQGGIQVRSHKVQGFCYGFVEFEDATAVQNAIAASSVMINGRQAYIEEKRATGSRGGSRGRFGSSGRGGSGSGGSFRSEGSRGARGGGGRGGYGGRSGDSNYRSEFPGRSGGGGGGRSGGSAARNGGDYQRPRSNAAAATK